MFGASPPFPYGVRESLGVEHAVDIGEDTEYSPPSIGENARMLGYGGIYVIFGQGEELSVVYVSFHTEMVP